VSAPLGSLLWGWAADKIGRRKADFVRTDQ
jgi:hypothetical protein